MPDRDPAGLHCSDGNTRQLYLLDGSIINMNEEKIG